MHTINTYTFRIDIAWIFWYNMYKDYYKLLCQGVCVCVVARC